MLRRSPLFKSSLESEPIQKLLGTISKDLVDALLQRASQVEKKLDKLIREPLLTGLVLMKQGLDHEDNSTEQAESRDHLLDQAHVSLTRAWALVSDSREDSVFVRSLDCVVLAAHRSHQRIANEAMQIVKTELDEIDNRVSAMEKESKELSRNSDAFHRWLDRGSPYEAKPIGHMEQRGLAIIKRDQAEKLTYFPHISAALSPFFPCSSRSTVCERAESPGLFCFCAFVTSDATRTPRLRTGFPTL